MSSLSSTLTIAWLTYNEYTIQHERQNYMHFIHTGANQIDIYRLVPDKCRIRLLSKVHNDLLRLLRSLFN
jgi:hypothetical protein